jgi:hypothetical protein
VSGGLPCCLHLPSCPEHLVDVLNGPEIDLRFAVDSKDPRLMKMFLDYVPLDELSEFIQRAEKIGVAEIVALLKAKAIAPEGGQ